MGEGGRNQTRISVRSLPHRKCVIMSVWNELQDNLKLHWVAYVCLCFFFLYYFCCHDHRHQPRLFVAITLSCPRDQKLHITSLFTSVPRPTCPHNHIFIQSNLAQKLPQNLHDHWQPCCNLMFFFSYSFHDHKLHREPKKTRTWFTAPNKMGFFPVV